MNHAGKPPAKIRMATQRSPHQTSGGAVFDTTMAWLAGNLHQPGLHGAQRHGPHGAGVGEDPREPIPSGTPGTQERRIPHVHGVEHTGASAAGVPLAPRHPAHREGVGGDPRQPTPSSTPGTQQPRFPSPDGIAHTRIPAAVIPTPGWRGACPPRQLRQWRWCRLWMWSAQPVSSSPVPAAGPWPRRHGSGGSLWLSSPGWRWRCGSGRR